MKIIRKNIDEIEEFRVQKSIGDIPYHKITIEYNSNNSILEITKKTNYCWGHCDYERMEEISFDGWYTVVFKTHDIRKLTNQLEIDCIKRLNEEIKGKIKKEQNEISDLYDSIDRHEASMKNLSIFFRDEKLKRINKN